MQSREGRLPAQRAAQLGQWDGTGVRDQQRIRLHHFFQARVQCLLGFRVLEDRLDDQVGLRDTRTLDIGDQSRTGGDALLRILHFFVEQYGGAIHRRLDVLQFPILQGYGESPQGTPRCDVATHHAGADHVHVADAMFLSAQSLQPVHQEEHADQVARGRGLRERDHRPGFRLECCLGTQSARALPRGNQGVGSGVVFLASLPGHLLDHLRRKELPRQPAVGKRCQEALLHRSPATALHHAQCGIEQH